MAVKKTVFKNIFGNRVFAEQRASRRDDYPMDGYINCTTPQHIPDKYGATGRGQNSKRQKRPTGAQSRKNTRILLSGC